MKKLDLSYANRGMQLRTLAVHDAKFHADDVFAAMLLRAIYPGIKIVRTRDQDRLSDCDILVDVGLEYDPERLRFDHHQEGKAGARKNGVEYSGFGLVWRHWGMDVCRGDKELYEDIDRKLVQPVDANDNGQPLYDKPNFEGIESFNLDDIMSSAMNPTLSEVGEGDQRFEEAMDLVEIIFERFLKKRSEIIETKSQILKDYEGLNDKRFIVDDKYRPVLQFSELMPKLLFYVFPRAEDDIWLIMTAQSGSDYSNRKDLPKAWAGKNGVELEEVSGIKGLDFCHNNLFICGAISKEAILQALDAALKN